MKLRSVPILNPPAFLIFSTLFEVLVTSALKKFAAGTVLEPTNKLLATLLMKRRKLVLMTHRKILRR